MVKWNPVQIKTKINKNTDHQKVIVELVKIIYHLDLATNTSRSIKEPSENQSVLEGTSV